MPIDTVRRSPAPGGSVRPQGVLADLLNPEPISETCGVVAGYPMPRPDLSDLADPRPRFPAQINVKITTAAHDELARLADELRTPIGALARRLLLDGLEQVAGREAGQ